MANLQNFRIDTEFTAVRQVPDAFKLEASIGGQSIPAYAINRIISDTFIDVPAGAYSPICSVFNPHANRYEVGQRTSHIFNISALDFVCWYAQVSRVSATRFRLRVGVSNVSGSAYWLPAHTVRAWLKLTATPF